MLSRFASRGVRTVRGARFLADAAKPAAAGGGGGGGGLGTILVAAIAGGGGYYLYTTGQIPGLSPPAEAASVDFGALAKRIEAKLDEDADMGPTLVRLGWHASGTFSPHGKVKGGSAGGTMRYEPEKSDGANAGLDKARAFLEPLKAEFPGVSYGDLWTFAAKTAIEVMDGPTIPWRPGRKDVTADEAAQGDKVPPNGRLPDATKGRQHIRDLFVDRMGFSERETVALIGGGHAIGRCHKEASGFDGPWTRAPTTFSNMFFTELLGQEWVKKTLDTGNTQYVDKATGEIMMLETDMELMRDPKFREYVDLYAKDAEVFYKDFADAFGKLLELGCTF